MSPEARERMQREALARCRNCRESNQELVIRSFVQRGIPAADILPGENVLTFNAWRALGRSVKRGEHGVKIPVIFDAEREARPGETAAADGKVHSKVKTCAVVFHVSQTVEIGADRVEECAA